MAESKINSPGYLTQKINKKKAPTLYIRYKSLKITTVYSVMLGTEMVEAEPGTAVAEKAAMQDMEETGSGMVKAD